MTSALGPKILIGGCARGSVCLCVCVHMYISVYVLCVCMCMDVCSTVETGLGELSELRPGKWARSCSLVKEVGLCPHSSNGKLVKSLKQVMK